MNIEPDISNLKDAVSDRVLDAMKKASKQLTDLGIRHALVGGLAVGAYGFVRATKDVDFLIGDEGFEHFSGGLIAHTKGIPHEVAGIPVDAMSEADEKHLEHALSRVTVSHGIPVAPIEALVYLKLKSPRPKDSLDIIELINAGMDTGFVAEYLRKYAPEALLRKFLKLVSQSAE